ncbi:MAG: hypothetical protein M3Y41_07640, partial [Pseudomonadota bacterium]|nr:hypothetical protein [Pseudomonadota bacterium]
MLRADDFDVCELSAALVIAVAAVVVFWLTQNRPTLLPVWAPWEFSWVEFLATGFGLWWYTRGLLRTPPALRPSGLRVSLFVAGVAAIYAVLET